MYGPGDTTLLPRLVPGVRRGRLVLPEGAEVRHSLTHIDNLVLAVRRALDLTAARTRLGYQPTPTTLEGAERW